MFEFNVSQFLIDAKERTLHFLRLIKALTGMSLAVIFYIFVATLLLGSIATIVQLTSETEVSYWTNIKGMIPTSIMVIVLCWMIWKLYQRLFLPPASTAVSAWQGMATTMKEEFESADHKKAVALHEVGHGLCHLAYLWPIEELRIHCKRIQYQNSTLNGQASSVCEDKDYERQEHQFALLKVMLGGYIAEQKYGDGIGRLGSETDLRNFECTAKEWLSYKANVDRSILWFHAPTTDQEVKCNKERLNELQARLEADVMRLFTDNEALLLELRDNLLKKRELVFTGPSLQALRDRLILGEPDNA